MEHHHNIRTRGISALTATASVAVAISVAAGSASAQVHPAKAATPTKTIAGHRLLARAGAVKVGTVVKSADIFSSRVFANAKVGIALADINEAQYPARTTNGGKTWRVDGPQVHVDAADAPEAVSEVNAIDAKTYVAFGSEAVDVTTNGGKTWFEAYLGDDVAAVVPGLSNHIDAYVQDLNNNGKTGTPYVYVTKNGGRSWTYSTSFGG